MTAKQKWTDTEGEPITISSMRVYSAYYKETQAMLKLIKCGQIYQQSNHPHNSEGSYRCGSAHFTDGQEYVFLRDHVNRGPRTDLKVLT